MQTPPEEGAGDATRLAIRRVQRRLLRQHLIEGVIGATLLAGAAALATRLAGWSVPRPSLTIAVAIAVVAMGAVARASLRRPRAAADRLERALPQSGNLIITAQELLENPQRTAPWMRTRVLTDADRLASRRLESAVVPLAGRVAALTAAAAVFVAALYVQTSRSPVATTGVHSGDVRPAADSSALLVVLHPPAHTNLPAQTLTDPERISAVEGTLARLTMSRAPAAASVRFATRQLFLARDSKDSSSAFVELTLRESGYLAVEGLGRAPALIPVAVMPDRAPSIRVEDPGKDLLLPSAERTVGVRAAATDDFGLAMMSLRYTKVSGSGEQYEFMEGEAPIEITRHDARSWHARGVLPLDRLGLQKGDSLVYRVVARDARPGERGFSSSDTFFVEVAGPGQVALEGFEMPPEQERYALSQQMIVLKIQRLRARERQLARARVQEETTSIAAEQRAVRGNFVFLTGGHVEDEEEEAEDSHEIQEGRLENTARREITTAISHMTRVEQALASIDTTTALAQARLAVAALQRAFGRNRYLLRTLPVRSRVDPSRRLTGNLDEASASMRPMSSAAGAGRLRAIEGLLAGTLAARRQLIAAAPAVLSPQELLERALAIDAASPEWQAIAAHLARFAGAAADRGRTSEALKHLDAAISLITARVRAITPRQAVPLSPPDALRGAWAEEARRR